MPGGGITISAARPVALGLTMADGSPVAGQSDLFGWTSIEITQEMVGQTVAVVTAIETKRTSGGATSGVQANFVQQVSDAGGIAGVAKSPDDAMRIVVDWAKSRYAKLRNL